MAIPEDAFAGAIATALVLTTLSCAAAELKITAKMIAATNAKRKVEIILFDGTAVAFLTVDLDLNIRMGQFLAKNLFNTEQFKRLRMTRL